MARIRTIKPDFFTSEDIVSLSPMARLLYIALWCEADREGRMVWRPATFKLRYFPGDKVNIDALARDLIARGLVIEYGEGYAYIPTFLEHQHINPRESVSAIPAPPEYLVLPPTGKVRGQLREEILKRDGKCVRCGSNESLEIDHIFPQTLGGPSVAENLRVLCKPCNAGRPVNGDALIADLKRDGLDLTSLVAKYARVGTRADTSNPDMHVQVGREGRERKGKEGVETRSRGSRLPPDWKPSEILRAWAVKERPDLDVTSLLAKFRDYWTAVPGSKGCKLDWDATFRNFVRTEHAGRTAVVPDYSQVIANIKD